MFWIPIASVLLLCHLFARTRYSIGVARFQDEYRKEENARKALADRVNDIEFESELHEQLDKKYNEWTKIVQKFMGGNKEWGDYADFLRGKLKAETVLMLQHGKLPYDLTSPIGFELPISKKSPSALKGNGISAKQAMEMNERFLLTVEDRLREQGIPAAVMCRRFKSVNYTLPYIPLRLLVEAEGWGSSGGGARFRFTERTV